jgi:hypothetical protein
MYAKDGTEVPARLGGRVVGCLLALVLSLSALFISAPVASAAGSPTYLALGDSSSFGFTQERFNLNAPSEAASNFEEGLTSPVARLLRQKARLGNTMALVNDSCPGETSSGLIGEDEALGGQASTESYEEASASGYPGLGDWHPCAYSVFSGYPLHNPHGGLSQLEDAIQLIGKGNVRAITLSIGMSDELAAIKQCEGEVSSELATSPNVSEWPKAPATGAKQYGPSEHAAAVHACISWTASNVTSPAIIEHIQATLRALDAAGYTGPIVVLGYYNANSFVHPGTDALQRGLNVALETEVIPNFNSSVQNNVTFANPFTLFNRGKTGSVPEQKFICKYTEMCNPSVQTAEGENPSSPVYQKDGDVNPSQLGSLALGRLLQAAYLANPAK